METPKNSSRYMKKIKLFGWIRRRVPLRKCKKCVRFRNGYCPLEDLEPCQFIKKEEKK